METVIVVLHLAEVLVMQVQEALEEQRLAARAEMEQNILLLV